MSDDYGVPDEAVACVIFVRGGVVTEVRSNVPLRIVLVDEDVMESGGEGRTELYVGDLGDFKL
jgi:hypothetical protein